jgi:hypothetical protein
MSSSSPAASESGYDSLEHAAIPFITVSARSTACFPGATTLHITNSTSLTSLQVNDEDKFEVNEEAITYLKSLSGKIAAVSIAGMSKCRPSRTSVRSFLCRSVSHWQKLPTQHDNE